MAQREAVHFKLYSTMPTAKKYLLVEPLLAGERWDSEGEIIDLSKSNPGDHFADHTPNASGIRYT